MALTASVFHEILPLAGIPSVLQAASTKVATQRDTGGLSRFPPMAHAAKDIARAFCYGPGLPEPIAEGIITQP